MPVGKAKQNRCFHARQERRPQELLKRQRGLGELHGHRGALESAGLAKRVGAGAAPRGRAGKQESGVPGAANASLPPFQEKQLRLESHSERRGKVDDQDSLERRGLKDVSGCQVA